MKKAYMKPEIVFESFAMTTSIAGDCEEIVGNAARGTCGVEFGFLTVFATPANGCNSIEGVTHLDGTDGEYNGFCYHVPTTGVNYFNS